MMVQALSTGTSSDGPSTPLLPSEAGLTEAEWRLARICRRNELIWLLTERYDSAGLAWNIDIVRQGATGRWVCQRYRFDEQAEVLYFLGESPLSDAEFRAARRDAVVFPVADWQDRSL